MSELLSKLREQAAWYSDGHGPLHKEAADEIERLTAALQKIADMDGISFTDGLAQTAVDHAKDALNQQRPETVK